MASNIQPDVLAGGEIFDRIFVPIDFSPSSHRALGAALELFRVRDARVCLFHAAHSDASDEWLGGIGSPAVGGDWIAEAKERLRRFVDNVAPRMAGQVELMAEVGDPVRALRRAAHEWGATLMIVSAKVHALLFRSPAEQLVRDNDIPILVVPSIG